ncbi:hypothetical protein E7681_12860 [Thalassobius vesicularis]|uniref:Uncharacterized protein n=1 Tax=Thalassobius vesicularis TaxID=1294297 RepID=A0A4S3M9I7_9RHOB|nr:hypothetical protein E7681_12860 [Thalassobius vesicularis]
MRTGSAAGLGAGLAAGGVGFGGSALTTCVEAGAGCAAGLPNVGCRPQTCSRDRVTRGTQVVAPPTPARMNAQPWLSTY